MHARGLGMACPTRFSTRINLAGFATLGRATADDVRNAERIWSYLWETREQTPMVYPMGMSQIYQFEGGGCIAMADSDWAGGEAGGGYGLKV